MTSVSYNSAVTKPATKTFKFKGGRKAKKNDQNPGPGAYTQNESATRFRSSSVAISPERRSNKKDDMGGMVGPGSYNNGEGQFG
jgi:hypothetical protein